MSVMLKYRAWSSWLLLGLSVCAGARAEVRDFDDCSPGMQQTLRARMFDTQGRLLPVFFARDALHYSVCARPADAKLRALQGAIQSGGYVDEFQMVSAVSDSPMARAAREACIDTANCTAEVYRRKDYKVARQGLTFAASGGLPFARFLGHLGKAGHFEITGQALAADGAAWSARAVEIMTDAARDADFYEWGTPAAHAQTTNSETGLIAEETGPAQKALAQWLRGYLQRAAAACAQQQQRQALYLLGYALHAVQDLAFHEGITNAEHAYLDYVQKQRVDTDVRYDEKFRLAVQASRQLLAAFGADATRAACLTDLKRWKGRGALGYDEKDEALGKWKRDFTVDAYFTYVGLGDKVEELVVAGTPAQTLFVRERWITEPRAQSIKALLAAMLP